MATKVTAAEFLCREVPVETAKGRLLFHTSTRRAFHYPWNFHGDEPDTLAWLDRLPQGAVLWDIGANIGQYAMYAALQPGVKVLAFEPAGSSYGVLVKNIEINGMDDRLAAYCLAFSDRTELGTLNMATTVAGSSMHAFNDTQNAFDEEIEIMFRQGSVGMSIDDFIRLFDPPLPTHIKIDVDSIEEQIIAGGAKLLESGKVDSVWIEVMGALDKPRNATLIRRMGDLGYAPLERANPDHRNLEFKRKSDR